MATTLIVLGACKLFETKKRIINIYIYICFENLDLRRDTYEDYTFPLTTVSNDTINQHGFELFSLRNYAKHYGKSINSEF